MWVQSPASLPWPHGGFALVLLCCLFLTAAPGAFSYTVGERDGYALKMMRRQVVANSALCRKTSSKTHFYGLNFQD